MIINTGVETMLDIDLYEPVDVVAQQKHKRWMCKSDWLWYGHTSRDFPIATRGATDISSGLANANTCLRW